MDYVNIPYVDKPVSRIIYGTANDQFMNKHNMCEFLDAVVNMGVTTIDTARNYQNAEAVLGEWIKKREDISDIVIISKCGHPSKYYPKRINEKDMREDLDCSMKSLFTDYIDIYMLHRDDSDVGVDVAVEVFNALHEEGKIGAFGGSNWTHTRIEEANEYAYKHNLHPFSVSSPNFSLADQIKDPWGGNCVTITGPQNKEAREWYEKNRMPVIAYSSLGRGLLSGKMKSLDSAHADKYLDYAALRGYAYPENFERLRRCEILAEKKGCEVAQLALAWIYAKRINALPVVTTKNLQRMRDNASAFKIKLDENEVNWLEGVTEYER